MTRLEIGDYDSHARTLLVRRGKNGKSRLLPVGGHAVVWLDRYFAEARPMIAFLPAETGLFLSGYGTAFTPAYLGTWVAKQMKRVGITKPGASHLFRHSCATHMHENGADIRHVQEMLGHARLDTTQIYTHVSIKALQEVHARCHPHGGMPEELPPSPPADTLTSCGTSEMVIAATATVTLKSSPMTAQKRGNPGNPDDGPAGNAPIRPQGPVSPKTPGFFKSLTTNDLDNSEHMQVRYYGYRYYDPVTGRWPTRDPIGEDGGIGLYVSFDNNAISEIDPTGLSSKEVHEDLTNQIRKGLRDEKGSPYLDCGCYSLQGHASVFGEKRIVMKYAMNRKAFEGPEYGPDLQIGVTAHKNRLKKGCSCECDNIKVIQIVNTGLDNLADFRRKRTVLKGDYAGWRVDASEHGGQPFVSDVRDVGYKIHPNAHSLSGGVNDAPGGYTRGLKFEAKTCLVCSKGIERKSVLGCISWGFELAKDESAKHDTGAMKITTIWSKMECGKSAGPAVAAALQAWDGSSEENKWLPALVK